MQWDIFVSYASEDRDEVVQPLAEALKKNGLHVWYDQIWRDLYARGLVNSESLHGMMTADGLVERRTTNLGEQFLRFIIDPSI